MSSAARSSADLLFSLSACAACARCPSSRWRMPFWMDDALDEDEGFFVPKPPSSLEPAAFEAAAAGAAKAVGFSCLAFRRRSAARCLDWMAIAACFCSGVVMV